MTDVAKKTDTVSLVVDGIPVTAEKGELVIRVAERMGIAIPRFCDHPLLAPAGACRQCLVEVEGQRKPVASCTQTVAEGMVVKTQLTSPVAAKAQGGVMELLLANHPLDCPTCDKGGECPLQNQAMSNGRTDSRFHEHKREYEKPIHISSQVLLDRERCILCQRCTRFSEEIAGDKFIDLMDRSSGEQINVYRDDFFGGEGFGDGNAGEGPGDVPFNSYFSGNTIQICPVGALTGEQYRFRARPFDLVSSPTACEHCAAGCSMRADHRRGKVLRRLAGDDPAVNEEWNCDKGRWGFRYTTADDRITSPLLRDPETGRLREASWSEALLAAAEGLKAARGKGVGVLTGGRLTVEDAYAYAKFARVALGTNDIDFRARPLSSEEADFLAASVAGVSDVTYADVENAPAAVIVGLEPEEECPILFLRLRKGHGKNKLKVTAVAPYLSRGFEKLGATLVAAVPGDEARLLAGDPAVAAALATPGALLIVGERLATVPGGLSAASAIAAATGARLAWVPRRAGDRGAVDAGCLPNLLPGGRPVTDAGARAELALAWGVEAGALLDTVGRDTDAIIAAAADGTLGGLLVAGVDPADLSDPRLAEQALETVGFVVSLELRASAVTRRADVVLPIAPAAEKSGTFMDWEGRLRSFETVLPTTAMTDGRVLEAIAALLGAPSTSGTAEGIALGTGDVMTIRRELGAMPASESARTEAPTVPTVALPSLAAGEAVLATWHHLIDQGTLLDGDPVLAGTARPPVARIGKDLAEALGVADGDAVTVSTDRGGITLPAAITDLPPQVVWLPTNSPGSSLRRSLGVTSGAVVRLSAGAPGPILAQGATR